MSFLSDIRTTTHRYVAMIAQQNQEISDFEKKFANFYSHDVFQQKRNELETEKRNTIESARGAIQTIVDAYKDRVKAADVLNGLDVTDDARLLTGAFHLTAADLEAMFDRCSGNRTMQRLIADFAHEHEIFIARKFYTAADKLEGAELMRRYAFNAFDRPEFSDIMGSDSYFLQITPEALKGE